jgi:hypothetical protein
MVLLVPVGDLAPGERLEQYQHQEGGDEKH